jgi:hypothetical protein
MISLRLLNPDASTLKRYGVNGAVYLEIEEESFKLRLTKALDEFSEVDAIRQEAAIPQSLPYTGFKSFGASAIQRLPFKQRKHKRRNRTKNRRPNHGNRPFRCY